MREKISFDRDWLFHKGDINAEYPSYKGFAYISAKTERVHAGPACKDYWASYGSFNNNKEHKSDIWENVNLPHDYMFYAPIDKNQNNALGFVKRENAWYIKKFELDESDRGKRLTLLFEGISTHATVYLNGCLLKHNMCGYTSFEVDISDTVKFGEKNTLSVYVSTEQNEGWWYEGGGIYRHVWLIKTAPVSVDLWGIFVHPEKCGEQWNTLVDVTIRNDSFAAATPTLNIKVSSADGSDIASTTVFGEIPQRDKCTFKAQIPVFSPMLWSPDTPIQYTLTVDVITNGETIDTDSTRFGFRSYEFTPDHGLFINGKQYKIKGVCGHSSDGLCGRAIPDNVYRFRAGLLKQMGANGFRTSHYPHAEALMDAFDELGFIVMDETRWFESSDEGKEQLAMLVKRDRNRPSVFMWSIGNEEPHFTTDEGRRIAASLYAEVKKLDPTRPVTLATDKPDIVSVCEEVDIVGINYCYGSYDAAHEKYPDKPFFASEHSATGGVRGWYGGVHDTDARLPAYDRDFNSYFVSREESWKNIASREWIAGGYQWMSIDYRGEAVWPRLCTVSGAIDMFYQKKDAFYQNLSFWSDTPMVHLLPHWNHRGLEGTPIRVCAYTNAERLELLLNGTPLGERKIEKCGHGEWLVPYEVGTLTVNAYNGDVLVATDTKVTSGAPDRLFLSLQTSEHKANGEDIAIVTCTVLDKDGNEVPDACPTVSFDADGSAAFFSCGSDITDHTSPLLSTRKMYAGKISVALRTTLTPGNARLYAHSETLGNAVLEFEVV